jgi:putative transposase
MQFEIGHLYHLYNQGNNRRQIFFTKANYLYFIQKIRTYILPYADIVCWCLMPNHFHLMLNTKILNLCKEQVLPSVNQKSRSINDSIGIMLRTYTRAINKQEQMSGSLFRQETKSICVSCHKSLAPISMNSMYGKTINIESKRNYPQNCFEYIHQNPVKAGLVEKQTDWQFSSAKDYFANRKGNLINKKLASEFRLF